MGSMHLPVLGAPSRTVRNDKVELFSNCQAYALKGDQGCLEEEKKLTLALKSHTARLGK